MMTAPIDMVLSRLDHPKSTGKDRWRAACPVCGGRNRSTLSVRLDENNAVGVKCFKSECSTDLIVGALGLELSDLFPPRDSHSRPLKRRSMISADQALELLDEEAQFVGTCAANIAHGVALTTNDKDRCLTAAGRITYIRSEVQK